MGLPTLFAIPVLCSMKRAIGDGLGRAARMGGDEHGAPPITVETVS
jgi:hypothetical protein